MRRRRTRDRLKYLFGTSAAILFFLFAPQVYSSEGVLAWVPDSEKDPCSRKAWWGDASRGGHVYLNPDNGTTWTLTNLSEKETYSRAVALVDQMVLVRPMSCPDNEPGMAQIRKIAQDSSEIKGQKWHGHHDRCGQTAVDHMACDSLY